MGYIYQLKNTLNDMIYIGQTINIKRRMKEYKNKSKELNSHAKYKIMEVMNEIGFDKFELTILEEVPNDQLNEREIYWIDELDARNPDKGYNSKTGGKGGTLTEESKKKMSESSKSFKHSEEEKIRRSKPIFIVRNNKLIPCISAKVHADSIGRTRSEVSAAIKRGIKINNEYIFYQNKEERIKCVNHIIEKKQKQNKVSKKSLKEYLLVYYLFFKESDFVKESVETNM